MLSSVWPDWASFSSFWQQIVCTKVAQIFSSLFGLFLIKSLICKKCGGLLFGPFLSKIWQHFITSSCHTGTYNKWVPLGIPIHIRVARLFPDSLLFNAEETRNRGGWKSQAWLGPTSNAILIEPAEGFMRSVLDKGFRLGLLRKRLWFTAQKEMIYLTCYWNIGPFTPSFSFISVFSIQLTCNKVCCCLDLNHRPVVLEATALPSEPQHLPLGFLTFSLENDIKEIHKTIDG